MTFPVVAVKEGGDWLLGRGILDVPVPVDVDGLLAAVADAPPAATFVHRRPTSSGRVRRPLDPATWVAPAGRLVALVTAEGLLVEDHLGRPALLAPDLVRVLDCIDHAAPAADLVAHAAARTGRSEDEVLQLVGDLLAADAVQLTSAHQRPPEAALASAYSGQAAVPGPSTPADRAEEHRTGRTGRVQTAFRLSSKLAPIRRLLGGGTTDAPAAAPPGRIPVLAPWHPDSGPLLALGMLTAAARHHDGGRLNDVYDLHVPETREDVLRHLAADDGPAVLLCSDYVWTLEDNLELARAARALRPGIVVLHGGPSCPRYEDDAERFLDEHAGAADVLVRGEGEATFVDLLDRLAPTWPDADLGRLQDCPGLTYRDPVSGRPVRTADRERTADLDSLPSPYLTGEFDHVPVGAFLPVLAIETNRGCPYGCSFCDWGSSTMSRIRKFDLARVEAEIEWAGRHEALHIFLTDANFGIWSRDVEVARMVADTRRRTGFPHLLAYTPAKNTTKHLAAIMDHLMSAGVGPEGAFGIQSTDPTTLEALDRSNISNDHFVALAAELRRRGLPLQAELMLGLPGQTVQSYADDLQFMVDHELTVRTWALQVLPNAPMNDPDYRARFQIEADDRGLVTTTSTANQSDRARMLRLRNATTIIDRFGLLRHVVKFLQWDHDHQALDVVGRLVDLCTDEGPGAYPVLAWTLANYDLHPAPPGGFGAFYRDVHRFVVDELDVPDDPALATVLALQQFLMPTTGRSFPATISLPHDYFSYYRSATDDLYRNGRAHGPAAPLASFGPATFTVDGDPLDLCATGVQIGGDSRDEQLPGDFILAAASANELESPLMRYLPWVAANGVAPALPTDIDLDLELDYVVDPHSGEDDGSQPVSLSIPRSSTRTPDEAAQ